MKYKMTKVVCFIACSLVFSSSFAAKTVSTVQKPVVSETKHTSTLLQSQQSKINVNKASAKDIARAIKGFGKARSEAIVNYRDKHGAFKSLDDLAQVKGVSQRFVNVNRELLATQLTLN